MTWVVAAVSPRDDDADATLATLRFASAFRNVRCLSRRNVDPDAELFVETESEARAVEGEVERLAKALAAARARRAGSARETRKLRETRNVRPRAERRVRVRGDRPAAHGAARRARGAGCRRAAAQSRARQVDREARALRREREASRAARRLFRRRSRRSRRSRRRRVGDDRRSNGDALDADPPPRSSAPATLTPLFRAHAVTRGNESDPPPPRTIAVPAEPGGRVRVGADRDGVDVAIAGFGVRPIHAVVLRDEAFPDAVFVAAADGDPDADVWVNGARVPSLADARAAGRRRPGCGTATGSSSARRAARRTCSATQTARVRTGRRRRRRRTGDGRDHRSRHR